MTYNVKLEAFEGPLDLLLHLIHRLEIDIYDIPMAELTEQYLQHVHTMRVLQLDQLSEYLVLAATLIEIKSKTLLPVHEEDALATEFNDIEEDPREELVSQLLEYRKYKEAAVQLQQFELERSQQFTRSPQELVSEQASFGLHEEVSPFDLIQAFQRVLDRQKVRIPLTARVARSEQTVEQRMSQIRQRIQQAGQLTFAELLEETSVQTIVVTFLSLLELVLRREVRVYQAEQFTEFIIERIEEGELS